MKLYGQLERAQLENLAADVAAAVAGRIWWNTVTGKAMLDDGTLVRAMLRNDGAAILGNNGTAANNIRLHRGASAVLQFVLGSDATAEGTLSTALAQISAKHENYTTAARPAFGNAGRVIWNTDLSNLQADTGSAWQTIAASGAANELITTDASAGNRTIAAGTTLFHPFLTVSAADTYTINGQAVSAGTATVDGVLIVNGEFIVLD